MSENRLKIPYQQNMLIRHCFRGMSLPVQPSQKQNMIPEKMTKTERNNDVPESNWYIAWKLESVNLNEGFSFLCHE